MLNSICSYLISSTANKKPDRDLLDVLELSDANPPSFGLMKSLPKSIDNILASMSASTSSSAKSQSTRKTVTSTEPLSEEAAAVLSQLPDLSFMHAKVLMFPVGDISS